MIYLECGKELAKGSLVAHRQNHHGVTKGGSGQEGNKEVGGNEPINFRVAFPAKARLRPCPVKGCSGRAVTCTVMWQYFLQWNAGTL